MGQFHPFRVHINLMKVKGHPFFEQLKAIQPQVYFTAASKTKNECLSSTIKGLDISQPSAYAYKFILGMPISVVFTDCEPKL